MTSVAAIIPCYNAAAFLAQALDSILAQTRPVSRVVVVDDGSTDDTVAIAEAYAGRGKPVVCLRTPRNGGPGAARNIGLLYVDEPVVAFLDADDVWTATHCEESMQLLERYAEAKLAFGCARTVGGSAPAARTLLPAGPIDALWLLLTANVVPQSAALVWRQRALEVGAYREEMRHAEDYDLWLRLAERGPFVCTGTVSCLRGRHDGQATRDRAKMYAGAWAARQRLRQRFAGSRSAADLARLDTTLASTCRHDLANAWRSRDRALVRAVLGHCAASGVPNLEGLLRHWERRVRFYWPVWRMAAAVWDAAPEQLRLRLRGSGAAA